MLELELKPVPSTAFVGESIHVDVIAHNRGTTPITIGDRGGPIRFELLDSAGAVRQLAPRTYRLSPVESPVAEPIFTQTIAPGASRFLSADVAEYAGEDLTPGDYTCTVVVGGARSESFTVTLVPPRIRALARREGLAAWLDGETVVVRGESRDPDRPVAVRAVAALADVSTVAPSDACFAVIANGVLSVGVAGPRVLLGWTQGPLLDLDAPRLVEGRSVDYPRTTFVIAGTNATVVASVAFDDSTPLGASTPRDVRIDARLPVVLPDGARTLVADKRLVAVWFDGTRVTCHPLEEGATSRILLDRGRTVLALCVGRRTVEVVLAGLASDQALTAVHVDLAGGVVHERSLPPAPAGATAWAIGPEPGAAVIVRVAREILVARDDRWVTVTSVDDGASDLAVVGAHWPRYFAQWVDPACGLRHVPIGT